MANIKSQIKRNKQNLKKRARNKVFRGAARTTVKNAHEVLENGKKKDAIPAVKEAISILDKTAAKGVIHKNNAARRKSRLMKKLAKLEK